VFALAYRSNGTGLGLSVSDIMDLDSAHARWFLDRFEEQIRKEEAQIRNIR